MPQSYYNASQTADHVGISLIQTPNVCPSPLTPPPEQQEQFSPVRLQHVHQVRPAGVPSPDNTAIGMAQSQEDILYLSPVSTPGVVHDAFDPGNLDKPDAVQEDCKDGTKTPMIINTYQASDASSSPSSPCSHTSLQEFHSAHQVQPVENGILEESHATVAIMQKQDDLSSQGEQLTVSTGEAYSLGLAPVDLQFDHSTTTQPWTFSNRRLLPDYPSHVFQPFSRYSGTQQSDRQIYNVDVTILTVDIAQCTMTGYLLIRGLTPEHDTLQTYFTGEIIGGPPRFSNTSQNYTFRTAHPSWGASEKTDLAHWSRFPAWRTLSSYAKRDINFSFPSDGSNWWEQENIFMRWKEHFLVPDHKTKSIAGASFEGFYYICLNQIQGRISGIYYHSKSEKYQQLELKHEGQPDIFNRGVNPCIEFR